MPFDNEKELELRLRELEDKERVCRQQLKNSYAAGIFGSTYVQQLNKELSRLRDEQGRLYIKLGGFAL